MGNVAAVINSNLSFPFKAEVCVCVRDDLS